VPDETSRAVVMFIVRIAREPSGRLRGDHRRRWGRPQEESGMPNQSVFIESSDPIDSTDTGFVADTASALHARSRPVIVESHDQIWHG
jgi:hypothetical protein